MQIKDRIVNRVRTAGVALAAIAVAGLVPTMAHAAGGPPHRDRHTVVVRKTVVDRPIVVRNGDWDHDWQNGSLYSFNRFDTDRRSHDASARARYAIFSKPYIMKNGHRYDRQIIIRNGVKYYSFVRR